MPDAMRKPRWKPCCNVLYLTPFLIFGTPTPLPGGSAISGMRKAETAGQAMHARQAFFSDSHPLPGWVDIRSIHLQTNPKSDILDRKEKQGASLGLAARRDAPHTMQTHYRAFEEGF